MTLCFYECKNLLDELMILSVNNITSIKLSNPDEKKNRWCYVKFSSGEVIVLPEKDYHGIKESIEGGKQNDRH